MFSYSRFFRNLTVCQPNKSSLSKTIMFETNDKSYEEAVKALNKLQTNKNVLANSILIKSCVDSNANKRLEETKIYLSRTGVYPTAEENLQIIHISGTKGKGSTCSLCESILRNHGYSTGFFSSPHLLEVRERIRYNGIPISKNNFAELFWNIFEILDAKKDHSEDLPFYFQFLFIMAIHFFIKKKVDVAIIEVGIGGEYDTTNIFSCVPVAGITSLGLDHTSILGDKIENIAWNKAGIMKQGSQVFTVPQPENAWNVLLDRSIERNCTLTLVDEDQCRINVNHHLPPIQKNISLAIKITEAWLNIYPKNYQKSHSLHPDLLKKAIEMCYWPGRYEIRQQDNIRYYLDGAHTEDSITLCMKWFINDTKEHLGKNILIFNLTHGRRCEEFFKILSQCKFETVMFVPNIGQKQSTDTTEVTSSLDEQLKQCQKYKEMWALITRQDNSLLFSSLQEAVTSLNMNERYNVLVTGSLYLVGAMLSIVDPTLRGTL